MSSTEQSKMRRLKLIYKTFVWKCMRAILKWVKRVYQILPISYKTKIFHRNILLKLFPRLFLLSMTDPASGTISRSFSPSPKVVNKLSDDAYCKLPIHFPISENPLISVIIPVYGKLEYTMNCLVSMSAHLPEISFEVIIVDDCSPDNSKEVLEKIKNVRLIKNVENQGFIRSCNLGAQAAHGEYLCFLNNDTEVCAGWLEELFRTFKEFPKTGLVGSKLIYPNGALQEAGGIIWQDGNAWNVGHLQDAGSPSYNYAREVDYCSGASIMIPKSLFVELGGFDEYYLPAYYEDVDLAFQVRAKGYRVMYQPLSNVVHYEGITSGINLMEGVKAYQNINSKKFFERWKDALNLHETFNLNVDKAKDRMSARRVLVIEHCTLTPNQDAGSMMLFNMIRVLQSMGFQVTFIPENCLYMPVYSAALQRLGIEILYSPYMHSVESHLQENGKRYDLVLLSRPLVVESNVKIVRQYCSKAKVLFYTVDIHFLRMKREAELMNDQRKMQDAMEMKKCEFAAISAVDASIIHSTAELELLRPDLPHQKMHLCPLIMDVVGTDKNFSDRCDIVFVGGFQHAPNVDAVQWFVAEVMPLLRQQLKGVRFHIVGSNLTNAVQKLASDDVIVVGFVEDLNAFLEKMRVSVAPLRYGAGIKGKIGSAMVVGLPVVASTLAAEGMLLVDGENILLADEAKAFADTVANLYEDEMRWNKLSHAALSFADQAWGKEMALKIFSNILLDIGLDIKSDTTGLASI